VKWDRGVRAFVLATCVVSACAVAFASGCGGTGADTGKSGLTSEEQTALDSATGSYLSQVDSERKNAAGTAYGACQQAASDYAIVHRQLFAREFARRAGFANGKGKRRVDLRSVCLVGLSLASR